MGREEGCRCVVSSPALSSVEWSYRPIGILVYCGLISVFGWGVCGDGDKVSFADVM